MRQAFIKTNYVDKLSLKTQMVHFQLFAYIYLNMTQ